MNGPIGSQDPFTAAIQEILDNGAELPLYVVGVAANGNMAYAKYVDDGNGRVAAQILSKYGGDDAPLPLNIMVTSPKMGEAHRVVVTPGGMRVLH